MLPTASLLRSKPQIQLHPPVSDTGYRVRVRTLVVDSTNTAPTDTIDDIYSGTDEEIIGKLLYQSESAASVYDFGDTDNYVAYLDVSGDSGATTHPQDAVFAFDTTAGEMIESVRYDTETGIAYIPKSVFEDQRMSELAPGQSELQAQTLVRCDPALIQQAYIEDSQADAIGDEDPLGETSSAMKIPVEISSDSGKASKMSNVPIAGNQFAINATTPTDASKITLDRFEVSINDGAITLDGNEDAYGAGSNKPSLSYNSETGDLNIHNVSPASVMNMNVHMSAFASPSMSSRAALATAGEIKNATDKAYKVGHYGVANCTGGYGEDGAATKTIRRWAPGQFVQKFSDINKNHIVDETCAYVITIGKCPSALGSSWTADGSKKWQANCVHISYPSGENPPSTGYYKVLAADWNNQTVTIAFFITCDSSGQEGGMVLTFDASRTTEYTLHKKANANTAQKGVLSSNVGGAVFGVYSSKAAAKEGGSKGLVKKITTNDSGIAQADFEEGKYYVRELSAPWPYLVSDQILTFTAKPKSDVRATMYEDSVPPIEIRKKILPSALSFSESDVKSGGNALLHVKTTVADNGRDIATEIRAISDTSNISVRNSSTSVLSNPVSTDSRFNAAANVISSMRAGDTITLVQSVKTGEGWSNSASSAGICSVSTGGATTSMSLPLLKASLEGVRYGIYSDSSCSKKVGETTLNKNGVGKYGTKPGEKLKSNTKYYLREIAGANGYTVSSEVYSVTTSRNSQTSVSVSDSFSTIILTKQNSAGDSFTNKFPQFKLTGARYGIFDDRSAAEQRDESRVVRTSDGHAVIIKTDATGKATTVSIGAGTYYVAELPSNITCVQSTTPSNPSPSDIESSIAAHDYTSKPNGKFLLDEQIHEVRLQPGKTSFIVSNEKVPVKIQLSKQSLRPDLSRLSQFSIEGAVFGVYGTESAARAAQVSANYGKPGDDVSAAGAVAVLYGSKSGLTTVSGELPLQDYWIKEIRAPRNYKVLGGSTWSLNNRTTNSEILHVSVSDFISSGKFIDGMIASPSIIKSNQPEDVTVQVHKDASEVPDEMKNSGNAMSLAGARFAIYRTYDDARQDTNRLSFRTDDQPASDSTKTELLTTKADGWSNKAVGLPAEENYWVREIEPPHVISSDPTENEKNVAESMYLLNEEPMKASFSEPLSVDMLASQDEQVKPVSITIGKYPLSIDPEGRNLHVGEKDANNIPYNDAYTDSALEGAVFALFDTHDQAANAMVTDDVSDLSVEQAAWDAGAIAVMTSDTNGVCGTVDNLKWKPDGYYLRELKAPNSGCYKRNTEVLLVSCDKNTLDSEHIRLHVDEDKISKFFELDEVPNYYYVKIEKTSTDPSVLADKNNYNLEGIHFGIYKTYEEAAAATPRK